MRLKIYAYENCDTCRKAIRFLRARKVAFELIPIREQPPTAGELRHMLRLQGGDLRKLFNTSGRDYQALGLKDQLPGMSVDDALGLLSQNGNLVKRPFVLAGTQGRVGFQLADWEQWLPNPA